MERTYRKQYPVPDNGTDRFDRIKLSQLLFYAQDAAIGHCAGLGMDWNTMAERGMFWAVTRTKMQIERLPEQGETITVETWPMPATRVAYPRATEMRDEDGNLLVRTISLWVLMDLNKRTMILPGKSGVDVGGLTRGGELSLPGGLTPGTAENTALRTVCFTDVDVNGHLNNARYMDWVDDLTDSGFHRSHRPRELTVCYLSEAREGQTLDLGWHYDPEANALQAEFRRKSETDSEKTERVFAARICYE